MSNTFITQYSKSCIIGTLGTKIFPSVKMAQAVLESGWGNSFLATNAHNFFGIKADASWGGPKIQRYDAAEGSNDYYRVYKDAAGSFRDHTEFLLNNSRYANNGVFNAQTPEEQCYALKAAGYATDPGYAEKLIGLINSNDFKRLDEKKKLCEQVLQ
jgi:peptidoglycan endopeptidase LytF